LCSLILQGLWEGNTYILLVSPPQTVTFFFLCVYDKYMFFLVRIFKFFLPLTFLFGAFCNFRNELLRHLVEMVAASCEEHIFMQTFSFSLLQSVANVFKQYLSASSVWYWCICFSGLIVLKVQMK
jgi:hypothetical protein